MKHIYLFILFIILSFSSKAQMQNLYEMSTGELKYSKILFDDNSLWGYFYLYELDKLKDSTKMEYIVLDKNLNKLYNGNFYEKKFPNKGIISYGNVYTNCLYLGDKLVLDILLKSADASTIYNSNRIISLVDNTVSDEFLLQGDQFNQLPEKVLGYKSRVDSIGNSPYVDPISGPGKSGFLVRSFNNYSSENEKLIKFYNDNREFCWEYVFDSIPRKKKYSMNKNHVTLNYLFMDSVNMYFREIHFSGYEYIEYNIIALDVKTGLKKHEVKLIGENFPDCRGLKIKRLNDTIAVYGHYAESRESQRYAGYFRMLIDKNCTVIDQDFKKWQDMSTAEYTITPKAKIKQVRHKFKTASFSMFNDGSMIVTNQEYNTRSVFSIIVSLFSFHILTFDLPYDKDLFFFKFDKEFNPNGITRVNMKKHIINSNSFENYLYTQNHGNNSSSVVCFLNKAKINGKSETELVINTLKNCEVKTERIPLTSSRKYTIIPNPAKDGYIMLNEYNKKDKYNEIRLEKLNN